MSFSRIDYIFNFDNYRTKMISVLKNVLNVNMQLLVTHIRKDIITSATTDTTLKSRSGHLRQSTQAVPAVATGDTVKAGVKFGTIYARVHVGKKGDITTIRPKRAKMLAIPIPAAREQFGMAMDNPKQFIENWPASVVTLKGESGHLTLYGFSRAAAGVAGKANKNSGRGALTPLYSLQKEVQIKARIFPDDLMKWVKPNIAADLKEQL